MTEIGMVAQYDAKRRFRTKLLAWFDRHKRDLPWRRDRDPYRVWISEIMLQQTRVAAAVEYYEKFLNRFPNVKKLASAREASVLTAWSGLGYYRRARMLHRAAKQLVREHGGVFPSSIAGLRTLPGVGRYTAAAIASIVFQETVAAVDGNVERVLQRIHGVPLKGESLWETASRLLDERRPGDFNQAMMELGATVCVPRDPKCLLCPVKELCATRGEFHLSKVPARQRKKDVSYALNCRNGRVLLRQRQNDSSLMPGMWELPETENGSERESLTLRHSITVTDYRVKVIRDAQLKSTMGEWISTSRLSTLPLTGLTRKILRKANLL